MNIQQEILNKLPKKYKLEIMLDNLDKTKLYSKEYFMKMLNICNSYIGFLYKIINQKNLDRIEINRKAYFGDKKLVNKIKEMLVE